MTTYTCPICAYSRMPYAADEGNICPCCGTEFGFDDDLGVSFRNIRDRWVANGTPWFSPLDARPLFWSGIAQLVSAGYVNLIPNARAKSTGCVDSLNTFSAPQPRHGI